MSGQGPQQHPQQPYPQYQQQYPPPQYPMRTPTGSLAWVMGFLVFVPIPFVSAIVAGVVMLAVGLSMRKHDGLAKANGRNAANWGIMLIALTVLLVGGHFVLLYVLTQGGPVPNFFPLGIPIVTWLAVMVVHVVFTIIGVVKANAGTAFKVPAIPFVRA